MKKQEKIDILQRGITRSRCVAAIFRMMIIIAITIQTG